MTNFNDSSVARIDDLAIPARAYKIIEEMAVVKNRTIEELLEEYILIGLAQDMQNHSRIGKQYSQYLKEKHQYDPQGRWKV